MMTPQELTPYLNGLVGGKLSRKFSFAQAEPVAQGS